MMADPILDTILHGLKPTLRYDDGQDIDELRHDLDGLRAYFEFLRAFAVTTADATAPQMLTPRGEQAVGDLQGYLREALSSLEGEIMECEHAIGMHPGAEPLATRQGPGR